MAQRAQEWRGLWHATPPGQLRHELVIRAIVYVTTPLALALLFGETGSLAQFGLAYAGSFMVSAAIGGSFEVLYHFVWPRLVRRKPGWPARIAGHAARGGAADHGASRGAGGAPGAHRSALLVQQPQYRCGAHSR